MGPILASVLEATAGYRWAFTIVSLVVLVVACLQLYSAWGYAPPVLVKQPIWEKHNVELKAREDFEINQVEE